MAALLPGVRVLDSEGRLTAQPPERENVAAEAIFVVDLEMSGPNAMMHEVLDLGGVRTRLAPGLPEMGYWGARVRPKHIGNAVPGALKVVGYSPKAWKTALDIETAFARFTELGAGAIVTGWGIGQDIAFIVESLRRLGRPWPFAPVALDVQPVARVLLGGGGQVDRYNLGHVADRLGIGRLGEHGALADAYAAYDVLVKLLERLPTQAAGERDAGSPEAS
jgi:DNA polymerase III epsilon subunit-like protein